jgi:hypothetical protein
VTRVRIGLPVRAAGSDMQQPATGSATIPEFLPGLGIDVSLLFNHRIQRS